MNTQRKSRLITVAMAVVLLLSMAIVMGAAEAQRSVPVLEIRNSSKYDLTVTWGTSQDSQPNSMGRMSPGDTDTAGEVRLGGHYWATGRYGDGNTVTADIIIGTGRNIIDLK